MQVVNVELHNIMRLARIAFHRWHSPIDADLLYDDENNLLGDTLLRMIGQADVDIPGGTAALEAAALEAAMLQTDRVGEIWYSQDPVNATMYPAPWIGDAEKKHREREAKAKREREERGHHQARHHHF